MKKINKCQYALDGLVNVKENFVWHEGKFIQIKNIENAKIIQDLVDKEMYIELGMELHKQISKPCYSSEDEEMIYLDLRRYYENWLAKYED